MKNTKKIISVGLLLFYLQPLYAELETLGEHLEESALRSAEKRRLNAETRLLEQQLRERQSQQISPNTYVRGYYRSDGIYIPPHYPHEDTPHFTQ